MQSGVSDGIFNIQDLSNSIQAVVFCHGDLVVSSQAKSELAAFIDASWAWM